MDDTKSAIYIVAILAVVAVVALVVMVLNRPNAAPSNQVKGGPYAIEVNGSQDLSGQAKGLLVETGGRTWECCCQYTYTLGCIGKYATSCCEYNGPYRN